MTNKRPKIVAFGEIMLRLSTPGYQRFVQTDTFDATYGGAEANVSVALAGYGFDSYFVTRLPEHEIGQAAINAMRRYGVNTNHIVRGGERVGVYYLEKGYSQRSSKVIYDRAAASVTEMTPDMVNWDAIFEKADWFHWTGITPALGKHCTDTLQAALKAAKKAGVTVSCDLNYRGKLWSEQQAQKILIPLMDYVDVCIGNESHFDKCLNHKSKNINTGVDEPTQEDYDILARSVKKAFDFSTVAITLRRTINSNTNGICAILHDDKDCTNPYRGKFYDIDIVDRVGGGDSFASGLICGLLSMDNTTEALEYAVAASALKHTVEGDFNLVSREEVQAVANHTGFAEVQR